MDDHTKTSTRTFGEDDRMDHVLASAPRAREALMRFHIGGCSHCGFDAADTVRKVAEDNGIPPRILLAALNDPGVG
jgi:hypothetical protein